MRYRPIRKNYLHGDEDYIKSLERYCTYLENKNKVLTKQCNLTNVVWRSKQFYCWAVEEHGSEKCRCKKQCKACEIMSKK